MICDICGSEMRYTEVDPIVESVRGVKTCVTGIKHHVCDKCGNTCMRGSEANKLGREQCVQAARGLGRFTPEEVRKIRVGLGLTQAEFEDLLGVTKPTCSRWENGAMLVSGTANKMMRMLMEHPEMAHMRLDRARKYDEIAHKEGDKTPMEVFA